MSHEALLRDQACPETSCPVDVFVGSEICVRSRVSADAALKVAPNVVDAFFDGRLHEVAAIVRGDVSGTGSIGSLMVFMSEFAVVSALCRQDPDPGGRFDSLAGLLATTAVPARAHCLCPQISDSHDDQIRLAAIAFALLRPACRRVEVAPAMAALSEFEMGRQETFFETLSSLGARN